MAYNNPKRTIISNAEAFQNLQNTISGTAEKVAQSEIIAAEKREKKAEQNRLQNEKLNYAEANAYYVSGKTIGKVTTPENASALGWVFTEESSKEYARNVRITQPGSGATRDERIAAAKYVGRMDVKPAIVAGDLKTGYASYLEMQEAVATGSFDGNFNADLRAALGAIYNQPGYGNQLEDVEGEMTGGYSVTAKENENGNTIFMVKGPEGAFKSEDLVDGVFEVNLSRLGSGNIYSKPIDVNGLMDADNMGTGFFNEQGVFDIEELKVFEGEGENKKPKTRTITRGKKQYEIFEIDPGKRQQFLDQTRITNDATAASFLDSNQQEDVQEAIGTYNRYIAKELNLPPMEYTATLTDEQKDLFKDGYQKVWDQKYLKFVEGEIPVPGTGVTLGEESDELASYEHEIIVNSVGGSNDAFVSGTANDIDLNSYIDDLNDLSESAKFVSNKTIAQLIIDDTEEFKKIKTMEQAISMVEEKYGPGEVFKETTSGYKALKGLGDPVNRVREALRASTGVTSAKKDKILANVRFMQNLVKNEEEYIKYKKKNNADLTDLQIEEQLVKDIIKYQAR
jgi:hypothetical protein